MHDGTRHYRGTKRDIIISVFLQIQAFLRRIETSQQKNGSQPSFHGESDSVKITNNQISVKVH